MRTIIVLSFLLSSCSSVSGLYESLVNRPSLVIGYPMVELQNDIPAVFVLDFNSYSDKISDSSIADMKTIINENAYYVVEATAGGFSGESRNLSKKRTISIIEVLRNYNVPASNIFIAEYDSEKAGKKGYIYQIIHQ